MKVIWRRVVGNPHTCAGRVPLITCSLCTWATCFPPCLTSIHLLHRIRRVPDPLSAPSHVIWMRAPAGRNAAALRKVSWRWDWEGETLSGRRRHRDAQAWADASAPRQRDGDAPSPLPSRASDSRHDLRPPCQHFLCFWRTGLGPPARGHKAASRDCFSPALQRPRWAACVEIAAAWARPVPVSPAVRASVRVSVRASEEEAWSWCLRHFSAPQARWVRLRGGGLAFLFC